MRSKWTVLAAAAATLWVAPQLAAAGDDVDAQLRAMNERMAQMEQKLQAQDEELAASKQRVEQQQAVIQDLDEDRQGASGLSKFLSETEFSGVMAASYTYNFKNLSSSAVGRNGNSTVGGENAGLFGIVAPHHQNSNNFQVDQLAFRMKKRATPESRGAWGASVVFGSSADTLGGRTADVHFFDDGEVQTITRDEDDVKGDLPHIAEAYAGYLFDVGSGVNFVLGRYMTPVGAESFFANENFNITRGLLWTLQPVNHTGGYIGGECECGLTWQLGAANGYGNDMADTDTQPTFVGSVGYRLDTLGFRVNGVYGGNIENLLGAFGLFGGFDSGRERNGDKIGLLDAVLTWDPSDRLSTWVNFDYYWTDESRGDEDLSSLSIYGFAGAGRYAITEATGFSLRYEWLFLNDLGELGTGTSDGADADLMSLTATLDHHLTENLVLSAEGRWDRGRLQSFPEGLYVGDSINGNNLNPFGLLLPDDFLDDGSDHQVLGLVQLRYEF